MERANQIAKTIALVLVRIIEVLVRTYVFLLHPIIGVLLALVLAVFKGAKSKPTYEERISDWCKLLIMDFIDWYDDKQDKIEDKIDEYLM